MTKSTLTHTEDVGVASNEYITLQSVNRNIRKLLENDIRLEALRETVSGTENVKDYQSRYVYSFGETVWFRDRSSRLWLLQCVQDGNSNSPQQAIDAQGSFVAPDFQLFGWEDLNENADVSALGLDAIASRFVTDRLEEHENDAEAHLFGRLDGSNASEKLMLCDMSNAVKDRDACFFPYKTGHFVTDAITNGTYRIWDCGIIEFNIVFRFGYKGTDANGYDILSCNDFVFKPSPARSEEADDYQENSKYFNGLADMKIFKNPDSVKICESVIGSLRQGNRNDYVNSYCAKLEFFPVAIDFNGMSISRFAGLDYMVFCGDTLCQDPFQSNRTVMPSSNQMTWCDRTRKSITAVYVTFPNGEGSFGTQGGITSNSFSCQVIGRWK